MDISLNYFGGSGGFYALWHILLGTDYRCVFDIRPLDDINNKYNSLRGSNWPKKLEDASEEYIDLDLWPTIKDLKEARVIDPNNLEEIYTNHWNIEKKQEWKKSEIWPDNLKTESLKCNKVFYYCNPTLEDWESNKNNFRIFLYTDIKLQWLLSKNKRAWAFYDNPTRDVNKVLPSVNFFNCQVYHKIPEYKEGDLYIKLQDIVNSNGSKLLDHIGGTVTQRNIDHNTMWLNLHNEEEKELLTT